MTTKISKLDPATDLDEEKTSLLVDFLYEHLGQFRDPREDISEAFAYAGARGGWIYTLENSAQLSGVCVVLDTGMKKFVPKNFLVYIAVDSQMRGQGLGRALIGSIQKDLGDSISLHVEHENPAKRLYERLGFTSKYAEMRWSKS